MIRQRLHRLLTRQSAKLQRKIDAVRFGRPAGLFSRHEFEKRYPGDLTPVPSLDQQLPRTSRQFGSTTIDFEKMFERPEPAGIYAVRDGLVMGPQGWAFTKERQFLTGASWFGRHAGIDLLPSYFEHPRRLRGVCLSLATDFGDRNYCHYMIESLPRFHLASVAGHTMSSINHVYLPKPISPAAALVLERLRIPKEKCIWVSDGSPVVTADVMLVTSLPGSRRYSPPWVPRYLQSLFDKNSSKGKKLYLPRDGTRRILNESELIVIAQRYGIEVFDYRKDVDVSRVFGEAELVVGPHGAAMTNIAFCRPGTKVFELFSSDHPHSHFYTLANSAGLDYSYLVGPSVASRPPGAVGPSPYDYLVDPLVFEQSLKAILQ